MKIRTDKRQEIRDSITPRVTSESSNRGTAQLMDNRTSTIDQRQLRSGIEDTGSSKNPIQRKNNTGLPDNLKAGIENLSGYSMDDVKVHYNSSKPAQLHAHAYAQGTDIHLAPGQEKHLPHEAWHVVQQKQGRVKPTTQFKGKVGINDDANLEKEADVMGSKAMFLKGENPGNRNDSSAVTRIIQLKKIEQDKFNVVGEEHEESDKVRGKEKKVTERLFGNDKSYWEEPEFELSIDGSEEKQTGDNNLLRFAHRILIVMDLIYRRPKHPKTINFLKALIQDPEIDAFINVSEAEIGVIKYLWSTKWLIKLVDILEDLEDTNKRIFKSDVDGYYESLREIYHKVASFSKYYKLKKWLPAYGMNQTKRKEYYDDLTERRNDHMHNAAKRAEELGIKGIWKIGQKHVDGMKKYKDIDYNLVDMKDFDMKNFED